MITQTQTPTPLRRYKLSAVEYEQGVVKINANRFTVASSTFHSRRIVSIDCEGKMRCSCPAKGEHCHTRAVRAYVEKFEAPIEFSIAEPCRCCGCRKISPNPNGCINGAESRAAFQRMVINERIKQGVF